MTFFCVSDLSVEENVKMYQLNIRKNINIEEI
jgi:hypothetical protein